MNEPQYRLLHRDEIKAAGDEFIVFDKLSDWKQTQEIGLRVGDGDCCSALYRRRIGSIKQQWIPLAERLPDKWPVWVTDGEYVYLAFEGYVTDGINPRGWPCTSGPPYLGVEDDRSLTHFLPLQHPPLPPRKSAEELAFEKYVGSFGKFIEVHTGEYGQNVTRGTIAFRSVWLAALEFAKGEK